MLSKQWIIRVTSMIKAAVFPTGIAMTVRTQGTIAAVVHIIAGVTVQAISANYLLHIRLCMTGHTCQVAVRTFEAVVCGQPVVKQDIRPAIDIVTRTALPFPLASMYILQTVAITTLVGSQLIALLRMTTGAADIGMLSP
jgi:hypothetical protein